LNGNPPKRCGLCGGLGSENPIAVHAIGLCPALAVTGRLADALVMGLALVFVCVCTNLAFSLLKRLMPRPARTLAGLILVGAFVTVFDLLLKAYYWQMSLRLAPYVALIVANCAVMWRAEAFAVAYPPWRSALNGLAGGLGYAGVLAGLAFFRELLGTGAVLGWPLLPAEWYEPNRLMVQAGGAFVAMGFLVAALNAVAGRAGAEGEP
jgi:Na+-transporting NADH:ubiquinone oxidoreductase subunit D